MNNDIIDKIIHNVITETMNKSYRGDIHDEIPEYIDDWDYDDEKSVENINKLSAKMHKDMSGFYKNNKNTSIETELEKLGFHRVYYMSFGGFSTSRDTEYYLIEKSTFNKIQDKFQSILNYFNYNCIKTRPNNGNDFGYDFDGIEVILEPTFTREQNFSQDDRIFYHATPDRNVNKILKQGLVPKDRKQMNLKRPERIYLTKDIDLNIVSQLENKNKLSYTILKVDLTTQPHIKLYNDPQYDEKGLYCISYIPPQCITVLPNQPHKIEKERQIEIANDLKEMASSIGLDCENQNGMVNTIKGKINDTELSFNITIYSPYDNDMYCAKIYGKTIKPNKNGKYLTRDFYAHCCCYFKQKYCFRSCFDYKDVKDLVINKYIKDFLLKPNTVNVHFR